MQLLMQMLQLNSSFSCQKG